MIPVVSSSRSRLAGSSAQAESLRLSAPPDFVSEVLAVVLPALEQRFAGLAVEARGDTRRVSVVEESYDAVVRLGPIGPSELLARPLGEVRLGVFARPGTRVRSAADLAGREFARAAGFPQQLQGRERGRAVTLKLNGRLVLSGVRDAARLAARSERLVVLPGFVSKGFVEAGELVRVLPGVRFPGVALTLLRPPRRRGSAVVDALAELLAAEVARLEAE